MNETFDMTRIIEFFRNNGKKDNNKQFFRKKKYDEKMTEEIEKWVNYEYGRKTGPRFSEWTNDHYLQVFEWALNTHLPKKIQQKAQSLITLYLFHMVTNDGKRKIPKEIKKEVNRYYENAKILEKYY